jgi:hypothetical protein
MYRLQKIDELLLSSHQYLTPEDECFFFRSYTRLDLGFTKENSFIMNFKKKMERKGKNDWKYKAQAILEASDLFIQGTPPINAPDVIFVPIPPSRMKGDPLYDDRNVQLISNLCNAKPNGELREIIYVNQNMPPTHEHKMSPDEMLPYLEVDEALCRDPKPNIVVVDDVITEGAHFKACQGLLRQWFPNSRITGLFIARTLH